MYYLKLNPDGCSATILTVQGTGRGLICFYSSSFLPPEIHLGLFTQCSTKEIKSRSSSGGFLFPPLMGKPEKSSALAVFPSLITQYRISDVLFNSVVHGSRGLQLCGPCTHDVLVFFFTSSCRGCAVFGEPVLSSSGQSGWPQFGRWWCSVQLSSAWIVVWKKRVQSLFSWCGLRLCFPASLVSEASLWQQKQTQSLGLCRQKKPGVHWVCSRAESSTDLIKFTKMFVFWWKICQFFYFCLKFHTRYWYFLRTPL